VTVADEGVEAQADWANLESPETYLGYQQGQSFASPGGAEFDEPRSYVVPDSLRLNRWALEGDWTIELRACVLNGAEGRIVFRFHARDVNLVLSPPPGGTPVPFHVRIDGDPPADARGLDVDEQGNGTVTQQRLYQLIRQRGPILDRTFEIGFGEPGVAGYVFTFG